MQRVRHQIGMDKIDPSIRGQGIRIAVLDSGYAQHPDLKNRVIAFKDCVNHRRSAYDDNGHGTHVCGILCGSGLLSEGRYAGIATKAELLVGKVLDHRGNGTVADMLEGLRWVLEMKEQMPIHILNISVGIGELQNGSKMEQLREYIDLIWHCGITVVCAAGNTGPADDSLSAIAKSDQIITVGCHDGEYFANSPVRCALCSGRGLPRAKVRKPDLVAPGTDITSCNAFYQVGGRKTEFPYVRKSGTSMATPIVSGVAALLLSKNPQLTNDSLKQRMTFSATDLGEAWNVQGWGMVNVSDLTEF